MTTLSARRIPATQKPAGDPTPQGLVVLLHGWGANADDLTDLVPYLQLPWLEFYCPDAPFEHPQVPDGLMWYDLQTQEGLPEGRKILSEWLATLPEQTGVPFERTILAGFSQGGAMTLDVGLDFPLAGLISWSGYLHATPPVDLTNLPPVLIVHGSQDPVVPLIAAQQARGMLETVGVTVEYHELDMGHEIQPAVINLSREFIQKRLTA